MEELLGIVFISAIFLIVGILYLFSLLKKPTITDFGWSNSHLEYISQVFMHRSIFVEDCGYKEIYTLLGSAIKGENEKPCNTDIDITSREIITNEIYDFFNTIKNEGETFFISINTEGWKETFSIDGVFLNKQISFEECIKKPYSIIGSFKYSLNLFGFEGYIKFSYCKWVD